MYQPRCKIGGLALIIQAQVHVNIGKIVRVDSVIEYLTDREPLYICEMLSGCFLYKDRDDGIIRLSENPWGCIRDSWLMPIEDLPPEVNVDVTAEEYHVSL